MGLLITFILGLFIVLGVLIVRFVPHKEKIEQSSIAIALGAMVMLLALDLVPEMTEAITKDMMVPGILAIAGGLALLKLLDHFVPEHEEHGDEEPTEENVMHIGIISAVAIVLHNVIEGMAVYSVSADSITTASLVALGVGLHNIPMGMLLDSTMQHEPPTRRYLVLGSAVLSTFVGGLIMGALAGFLTESVVGILIAVTIGMLLFIIIFELIPHLWHSKNHIRSLVFTAIGALIVWISMLLG